MTLDGFLPEEGDRLLHWLKTDVSGFPYWHERSTFTLFPGYPMLDLVCEKDCRDGSFIYTAEISDKKSLGLLHGLSIYHLIDEIVVHILPLTYGNGIPCMERFPGNYWELCKPVVFRNGICRLIYRKIPQ